MRLFYCYSNSLKAELKRNGFRYLHFGIHSKTHKTFWVFEGSVELNSYLGSRKKY